MFDEFCGFYSAFVAFVFGVGEEEFYAVAGVDLGTFPDELLGGDKRAVCIVRVFWTCVCEYEVPDWDVAIEEFLPILFDDLQGGGNSLSQFSGSVCLGGRNDDRPFKAASLYLSSSGSDIFNILYPDSTIAFL